MIKINLLGRARPKVKRRVAITGALQLALFIIPVALALAFLIGHYFFIKKGVADLDEQIKTKQAEKAQMAQLEKEIKDFEARQAVVDARIKVIEDLKRNQAGPVTLLEAVGQTVSLTDQLWLTAMEEKGPSVIEFKGQAASIEAVANFMTNLRQSGYFENVEMKESVQKTQRQEGTTNFEFILSGKFSLPTPPEAPAEGGAAASGQS
jgi:Tfp pilus assembly protein PilN